MGIDGYGPQKAKVIDPKESNGHHIKSVPCTVRPGTGGLNFRKFFYWLIWKSTSRRVQRWCRFGPIWSESKVMTHRKILILTLWEYKNIPQTIYIYNFYLFLFRIFHWLISRCSFWSYTYHLRKNWQKRYSSIKFWKFSMSHNCWLRPDRTKPTLALDSSRCALSYELIKNFSKI